MKIRYDWECGGCGAGGNQDDFPNDFDGCCPNCHDIIDVACRLTLEEFLTELGSASPAEIAKNINAIRACALDLSTII